MRWKFLLKLGIGLFILFLLVFKIGWVSLFDSLKTISLVFIPVIFLIWILLFLISSFNLRILVHPLIPNISFLKVLNYYLVSWSLGLFSPGKLGEFSFAYFLKKEDIALGKGIVVPLLDKLLAAIVLFIFSSFGFFIFFEFAKAVFLSSLSFFLILVACVLIFSRFSRLLIKKYILRKYHYKFEGFYKTLVFYIHHKKRFLFLGFLIAIFKQLVLSLLIYSLFLSFNISAPFFYVVIITSMVNVLALIPVSISGLGIKEASTVLFYSSLGIYPSIAFAVAVLSTASAYIFAFFIILFNRSL